MIYSGDRPVCGNAQSDRDALRARLESDALTQILTGHCLDRASSSLERRASARSDHSLGGGGQPPRSFTPRSSGGGNLRPGSNPLRLDGPAAGPDVLGRRWVAAPHLYAP